MDSWPFSMKIRYLSDPKKRVRLRKFCAKFFDSRNVIPLLSKEEFTTDCSTFSIRCKIMADKRSGVLDINDQLLKKFNLGLKKIFGPELKGIISTSGGLLYLD